jgi:hypothetical protein
MLCHPTNANVTNQSEKNKPCVQNRKELVFSHGKAKERYTRANTRKERGEKKRRKKSWVGFVGEGRRTRRRGKDSERETDTMGVHPRRF